MKTLVIHPEDRSTQFLDVIYKDKGFTVVRKWGLPMSELRKLVRAHDRIMFMGHGGPFGLFGYGEALMNPHFQDLLKTKQCVCIWCNADKYVERFGITGFYTGMFISEVGEAAYFGICKTQAEIDYSNNLFVQEFREVMDSPSVLTEIKERYTGECEVIKFNNERLYYTDTPIIREPEKNDCDMKINSEEHREGLIKLYKDQQESEDGFMYAVLKKAILSLEAGNKPQMVENWVVKMEKEMRKKI